MERRTEDVTIKVDNRNFALHPMSKMTLDGVMAYIDVAIQTKKYKELNDGMLHLLHSVMLETRERMEDDYDDKPERW